MRRWMILAGGWIATSAACSNLTRTLSGDAAGAGGETDGGTATGSTAGAPPSLPDGGDSGGDAGRGTNEGGVGGATRPEAAGAAGATTSPTLPTIVEVSPLSNATGVASATPLKITFSEEMDTSSVEAALGVSTLAGSDLNVSWASGSKVVSILPEGGWKYASGTDPALTALKYTVTLSADAKDAQGDALGEAFSASFSTRRRLTQTLVASSVGSYSDYGHAVGDDPLMCSKDTDSTIVEKWSNPGSAGTYFTFIVFDTSALGVAGANHAIEAVTLLSTQTAGDGDFYSAHQVVAAKLAYHAIDDAVLGSAAKAQLGVFSSSASTLHPSINVLSSFAVDFDAGQTLHLFRLAPSLGSSDSTAAHFLCGGFSLAVTHVLP